MMRAKYLVAATMLLSVTPLLAANKDEPITRETITHAVSRYKDARFCIVTSNLEPESSFFSDKVYNQTLVFDCDGAHEAIYGSTTQSNYLDARALLTASAGDFVAQGFLATQCDESQCILQRQDTAFGELLQNFVKLSAQLAKLTGN
jgi:hypothetical protein